VFRPGTGSCGHAVPALVCRPQHHVATISAVTDTPARFDQPYLISPSRHVGQAVGRHLVGPWGWIAFASVAPVQEKTPEPTSVLPLNEQDPVGNAGDYGKLPDAASSPFAWPATRSRSCTYEPRGKFWLEEPVGLLEARELCFGLGAPRPTLPIHLRPSRFK
jgi:hypothetical protein